MKIIVLILAVISFGSCIFGLIAVLSNSTKIDGIFFPLGLLGIWICGKFIEKWRI